MVEAPFVSKMPRELVKSGDFQLVSKIEQEYLRAMDADYRNRRRELENWGLYFGIEGMQWEVKLWQQLLSENRNADSFNIIQSKVDTLAGSLMSELFDIDWKPINGVRNSLTEAIKHTWYSDRELCHYEQQVGLAIRDALVYRGIIKQVTTDKHDALKNISFQRATPGFITLDPHWVSDDDNDLDFLWEVFHLPAVKVRHKYGVNNPRIETAIRMWQQSGGDYHDAYTMDTEQLLRMQMKDHLHKVIEFHWMEDVKTTRVVGQKMDYPRWIVFPVTKDRAVLEQFMVVNSIDPMTMREAPYSDRIHHVTTICPSLVPTSPLEDGISEIQPKRLPYIILSANRAFGRDKGMVDDLKDIQRSINKREAKLTDIINTSTGGGKLVNRDLFKTDKERERFRKEANNPSGIWFVDGDELTKERAIHYINSNQFPSTVVNQLQRLWDVIDRISKVPAAMDAMAEGANESGILYARKLQMSRVGLITLVQRVKDFRKKLGEVYYEQWRITYTGPERKFSTLDAKYSTILNKRVFNDAESRYYIQNRPDMIPRCSVIVMESKSSPNRMLRDREVYFELFKFAAQSDPEHSQFFFRRVMDTMELSEEDKVELKEIELMQKVRMRKKLMADIAGLDAQAKQAALMSLQSVMQIQQIIGQQMPQAQLPMAETPEDNFPDEGGQVPAQLGPEGMEPEPGAPGMVQERLLSQEQQPAMVEE